MLLATQELADLDRAAPGFRDQVLGNTAVKIAHRQDVPASARTIAELVGTEWVWSESRQIYGPFAAATAAGGTRREVEQLRRAPQRDQAAAHGRGRAADQDAEAGVDRVRVWPPSRTIAGDRQPGGGADVGTARARRPRDQPRPGVTR